MDELLFTSASILDLLSNIDELKDKNIDLIENESGLVITIGDSSYEVNPENATVVEVEPEVVEEIDDATTEAYQELESDGVDISQEVQGGPIKSLLKTLLLGGMIKMTAKMLKE